MRAQRLDRWLEPGRAFFALRGMAPGQGAFWLDASRAEPGLARYSFVGLAGTLVRYRAATRELTITRDGVRQVLRQTLFDWLAEQPRPEAVDAPFAFTGGYAGYIGYEMKAECGAEAPYLSPLPDAALVRADVLLAFDHEERTAWLVAEEHAGVSQALERGRETPPQTEPSGGSVEFRLARGREQYLADVARCQQWIREGESYELCLTNQVTARWDRAIDPASLYLQLRRLNPAPYAAFLDFGDYAVLSSSPERFLEISAGGAVESKPIKGTRKRGATMEEDAALRRELRHSVKDRAENLMITDLLRNDLGRVCRTGSVHVPKLMDVETYATVHQLVSTIRGELRPGLTALDCMRAAFPGGSMTGAPKLRSMSLLDELEHGPRGVYSGAIGYLADSGAADFSIAIRTIVAVPEAAGMRLSMGVGGAIVALSEPEAEFEETLLKARAQIGAIVAAVRGEARAEEVEAILDRLRVAGEARLDG